MGNYFSAQSNRDSTDDDSSTYAYEGDEGNSTVTSCKPFTPPPVAAAEPTTEKPIAREDIEERTASRETDVSHRQEISSSLQENLISEEKKARQASEDVTGQHVKTHHKRSTSDMVTEPCSTIVTRGADVTVRPW